MNPEEMLQMHREQEEISVQQELQQHLTHVQNWGGPELGEDVEIRRALHATQLVQEQRERNVQLQTQAQQQLPPVQAHQAAQGAPQAVVPPVKKSRKQQRRERQLARQAQKQNPLCDYTSYVIRESLQAYTQQRVNSFTPELSEACRDNNIDLRMVRSFMHGCRLKENGQPLDQEQAEHMRRDQEFLQDYTSMDVRLREPHLRRIVDEVLAIHITPEMLTKEYIEGHVSQIRGMGDKLTYISNVRKDPVNKPFFDQLPQMEAELLDAQETMGTILGTIYAQVLSQKGVSTLDSDYLSEEETRGAREAQLDWEPIAAQMLETREQAVRSAVHKETNRKMMDARQRKIQESEQRRQEMGDEAPELTGYVTKELAEELGTFRDMIQKNPQRYADNQGLVDDIYQQIYRAIDACGDLQLQADSYRSVVREMVGTQGFQEQVYQDAVAEQKEAMDAVALVRQRIEALEGAMRFLLENKSMDEEALELMREQGHLTPEMERVNLYLRGREVFLGPNGAVAAADEMFLKRIGQGEADAMVRSDALQALGIRSSESQAARIEQALRGTTYVGLPGEMAVYFHALEKTDNFQQLADNMVTVRQEGELSSYTTGPGMDRVCLAVLGAFERCLMGEKSMAYLREMNHLIGGAQVFGGRQEQAINFLAQHLLILHGANVEEVYKGQYDKKPQVQNVAKAVSQTLRALPILIQKDEEERKQLPQQIQMLLDEYEQMLMRVIGRL